MLICWRDSRIYKYPIFLFKYPIDVAKKSIAVENCSLHCRPFARMVLQIRHEFEIASLDFV